MGIGSIFTAVQGMGMSVQPKIRNRKKLDEELTILTLESSTLERKLNSTTTPYHLVNGAAQNGATQSIYFCLKSRNNRLQFFIVFVTNSDGICKRDGLQHRLNEILKLKSELGECEELRCFQSHL